MKECMKNFIIVSLAIFLLSGCSKTPEDKINDLYQDGIAQISDFQIKSADSTFNAIFEIDPGSMLALVGRTKVLDARLQYFDAVEDYSTILTNSTDYEDAFVGLYDAYKNLGFYHEALEAAVHYNKLWNSNAHTKFLLGDAYKNLGEYKRAETYLKQAFVSGYEHKRAAQLMLATVIVLQGDNAEAATEAKEAFADNSDNAIFYNAAAEYYLSIGMLDSSMTYNKKLFTLDNSNIQNVYTSFKRALKNNYLSDARNIINTMNNVGAEPLLLEAFKLFYGLHIDNKSMIRMHGQNYRAIVPASATGKMYELYSRAEISDKLTMMQDLAALDNEIAKGQFDDEFGSFYYYAMLMLNVEYEKNPGTISKLNDIRGLQVNRKLFRFELAITKHVVGLFDECYADLKKIEAGHQNDADWLTGIAETWRHFAIRKYDKAENYYKKALVADSYYLPAFVKQLAMFEHIKEYEKAVALFDTYPQFSKNKFIALSKTKYLFLSKKYDEGFKQLEQFASVASGNIVFIKELVAILKNANRTDDIDKLLGMMSLNNADAYLLVAFEAQENSDFKKSLTSLDEAIKLEPNFAQAHILKARAMYNAGQKTESYDLFEKNLLDFPNNPQNLLYYSQVLSSEGIDFGKASNMGRQAVFEGYGRYPYLISLADIYYKMGRYDLCRGESAKAVILSKSTKSYPLFLYGVASIKANAKWADDGIEALRKAIKLGLSDENLKEANAALK